MNPSQQPLSPSPLVIERYEFVRIDLTASEKQDAHRELGVKVRRQWSVAEESNRHWCMKLIVRFGGEKEGVESIYSGEIHVIGYFRVHEKFPEEKTRKLIEVTAASILYGACREMLANLTARGPYGMVSLPSISFVPFSPEKLEKSSTRIAEETPSYGAKKSATKKRLKK
jgi:preprotein translocase subunit SecB